MAGKTITFSLIRQAHAASASTVEELEALHGSKSKDYGSEADPLANIRQGAEFGADTVEHFTDAAAVVAHQGEAHHCDMM
jgi:hypothetical protein